MSFPLTGGDTKVPEARQFVTTHWSAVVAAGGGDSSRAQSALAELCQTYWYPLYVFVRRQGHTPHDAEDLTQEFFARLLEKNYLASANQEKGRFRSFLLIALKRFLANEWDRVTAAKRGGRRKTISIDPTGAEARYRLEPAHALTAEKLYERHWAQTLLDRVMGQLQQEYARSGKAGLFEELRSSLGRRRGIVPYAEIAARFQLSEAAVKMAVQRLRARYRHLLRLEIGKTVSGPEEVEEEIRHLFSAFSQ